nr:MAG TPA: hypothetical protein [Caudoviricetes sp.]
MDSISCLIRFSNSCSFIENSSFVDFYYIKGDFLLQSLSAGGFLISTHNCSKDRWPPSCEFSQN